MRVCGWLWGGKRGAYQAVQLVRHGGREDGLALVPHDGCGQVVVAVRLVDPDEAHADCGIRQ